MGDNLPADSDDTAAATANLVLVGLSGESHVGRHLSDAAKRIGVAVVLAEASQAYNGAYLLRKLHWWWDRRPLHLGKFGDEVVRACERVRPRWLLTTGLSPVSAEILGRLGGMGVIRLNYLTDDPWNCHHSAKWFFESLLQYDLVFSPRRANIEDLRSLGCRAVEYLPFAFNPAVHFEERTSGPESEALQCDVMFVGGGDADRVPYIKALRRANLDVAVYGGYWNRFGIPSRGICAPSVIRKATSASRICLCLVRRANRDGHVMRSFEIAACGGCMLIEDTAEHRDIFGDEGRAVMYFGDCRSMVERAQWLLSHPIERRRLAETARRTVLSGGHSYEERLRTMLRKKFTA